jgi:hypothetical protein
LAERAGRRSTGNPDWLAPGRPQAALALEIATPTKGDIVFSNPHLIGPLALRFAPNGDLLTANGDATPNADPLHPSEIVEFTRSGEFVREYNVDASQGGAFGLDTLTGERAAFNFAVIDDVTNSLSVYRLPADGEDQE